MPTRGIIDGVDVILHLTAPAIASAALKLDSYERIVDSIENPLLAPAPFVEDAGAAGPAACGLAGALDDDAFGVCCADVG
jgi:hypothetical protein